MNIKINQNRVVDPKMSLSAAYLSKMVELIDADERVLEFEADLAMAMGPDIKFNRPDRLIDCGIQEANMVGVAAGISATGYIPFVHTFGCFMSRRVFDQAFLSAGYAQLNVKFIGSDPGVTAKYNGGTHMPFEDMGTFRMIPGAMVFDTNDPVQLRNIVEQIKDIYGVQYIRFDRKDPGVHIYEEGSTFELGKGVLLREGEDATVIASGIEVAQALDAADQLEKEGVRVRVIDMFTVKPIDKEIIIESARKTGAIVTAENHNVINGLGSAVAEVVVENCPVPMGRIGAQDMFGQVGDLAYLMNAYKLNASDIAQAVKDTIRRK